jgi:hypothetical protein
MPARLPPSSHQPRVTAAARLWPGTGPGGKVRSQRGGVKRACYTQRAWQRPTPLRQFEACQAEVQVCAPAGLPRLGVGHDAVPGHH